MEQFQDRLKSESAEVFDDSKDVDPNSLETYYFTPIGYIQSMFKRKNGTPRQSGICNKTGARLEINSKIFNNPEHAIDGLENFSHIWLLFVFHKNNNHYTKAKVRPPRLNGKSQGVFATRSPYRYNPVGLTLAQITKIEGHIIYLSGVDIIDGTPIIDIKPYIGEYDNPKMHGLISPAQNEVDPDHSKIENDKNQLTENNQLLNEEGNGKDLVSEIKESSWIKDANSKFTLNVRFTPTSESQLSNLKRFQVCEESISSIKFLGKIESFKESVHQILSADPRSSYRRNKCQDRLYFVNVDFVKLTCWFDDDSNTVEVLKASDEEEINAET